jgi:RNA polymerase subunit RPABC4/transcription elongation factor Spt4
MAEATRWNTPGACRGCGAPIGRGLDWCRTCISAGVPDGFSPVESKLEEIAEPAKVSASCADCGVEVPAGKTYCPVCGAVRIAEVEASKAEAVRGPSTLPAGDPFGAWMLVLFAIGFLVALGYADSPYHFSAFVSGVSMATLGLGGFILRSAILSALRIHDRARRGPPAQ